MSVVMVAVFTVVVPATVAAVVTGLGRLFGRGDERGRTAWWSASAVGAAYIAGHLGVAWPAVPPVEVTDRIPWVAFTATALALAEAGLSFRPLAGVLGRLGLLAMTVGLVLGPVIGAGDLSRETILWSGGAALVALAFWANIEALDARPRGSDVIRALVVTACGSGLVLLLSGSVVLGQLGVALAFAIGATWLASGVRIVATGIPAGTAVLTALVLEGYVYASTPVSSSIVLAAAPLTVWLTRVGPMRRLSPLGSAAFGLVLVLIPVGIAVGLAFAASPPFE